MKKLTSMLLILALCLTLTGTALAADSDFLIENGLLYGYNGPGGHVVIPDGVTKIGSKMFSDDDTITGVTIPDSVTEIGEWTFSGEGLTSVYLPDSITSIGSYAFAFNLIKVEHFPSNLQYLGSDALNAVSMETSYDIRLQISRFWEDQWIDPDLCIESQSERIQTLSDEITAGLGGDYEKAKAIVTWVGRNIKYSISLQGWSVEEILDTGYATCGGYTDLTNALLQAQGIPAISVSGMAGSVDDQGSHAWTEAYIDGRWVIIDSTWNRNWGMKYFDISLEELIKDHILTGREAPYSTGSSSSGNGSTDPDETKKENPSIYRMQYSEGTISTRPGIASPGTTVTVTVTPNSGYRFCGLEIRDVDWSEVRFTKTGENTFTFVMPDCDVYLMAEFQEKSIPKFTDVSPFDYYYMPVLWAIDKNITAGTTDTTFSPNQTCTTAQILTFLWRAKGEPAPTIANPFSDVSTNDYYYKAALWAYEKGLVSGTSFGANTPCTRAQTVTYQWKLAGSPSASAASFTDVSASADYAKAVAWAVQKGVTAGTSDTTFSPNDTCTRGQIVTFLYRDLA